MEKKYSIILDDEYQQYISNIREEFSKSGIKLSVSEIIRSSLWSCNEIIKSNKSDNSVKKSFTNK